ncbi:ATP-dependent RNA helicase DeaD [Treponema bryantii]|uniref:ATP-dependent RNA helicase DeaD n=1 Tax=Treponema bryantii TaxID=163 RepID=A0A1I3MFU3_9SPIR|nr:DEAD/DEAH box helicase [Treponema bryantii]SFI95858.1 ATP-dependent RNA helicase DeaD [Treponema bryantii]
MTDFIENTADQTADSTFTDEKIENETPDTVTFEDLGLDEYTLKAVEKKGFVTPSPIQVLAIPRLLTGDTNLIARARTGTGKTAAFGLPIIQNVRGKSNHVEALILEPTRELAMQTCTEMQSFSTSEYPRTTVLYGGASYAAQIKDLKRGCEVVVGTPGRIKDHIDRKTLDLSKIKYFILDEGDEMLDMGFIDDIEEIFRHANPDCRILLFSATMPAPILKIAGDFMGEYDIIEEENVIDEALLIDQKYWVVKESEKIEALVRLIDISPDFYGLVFTMTKSDADRVTRELDLRGYEAAALHGDIMQNQREKVLERFRMKKTRILVATDVAARGIDIKGVSHVVNYSLPFDTATYVHRIGRTGRAGTEGIAVTFVRPEERRKLGFLSKNIKKATKSDFTEGKIPSVNEVLNVKNERVIKELKEKLFNTKVELNEETAAVVSTGSTTVSSEDLNTTSDTAVVSTSSTTGATVKSELLTPLFTDLAAALCEGQDAQQVLAGVLSTVYGDQLSPKHYGKINTISSAPRGDQKRIFVSLGKRDGYHAKEIADYFSELLHIPGRLVDDIDVAQQFSLVSLPVASARKAIELSKSNKKVPHMHYDDKEEGRGSRRSRKSDFDSYSDRSERSDRPARGRRDSSKSERAPRGRLNAKGNKPNVHAQTERSSSRKNSASLYKKSGKKAERF